MFRIQDVIAFIHVFVYIEEMPDVEIQLKHFIRMLESVVIVKKLFDAPRQPKEEIYERIEAVNDLNILALAL